MIYITKKHLGKVGITEERINAFIEQFREPHKSIMLGQLFFLSSLSYFIFECTSHERSSERQKEVMKRAGALAERKAEDMFDRLTELYAEAEEQLPKDFSANDYFIKGYTEAISYYTELTHDILEENCFTGKDKDTANGYYIAVGLELSMRLREMLDASGDIAAYLETVG